MRVCLSALIVTVGLTGGATAGPIQWSYTPTLIGDRGHSTIYVGFGVRPDAQSPDGWMHYTGYATLTPSGPQPGEAGSASVLVGGTGYSSLIWDNDDGRFGLYESDLDQHFRASVTITDDKSGQTGTFTITGSGDSGDSWLGLAPWLNLDGTEPADQVIGGNRYRVQFRTQQEYRPSPEGPTLGQVFADVQVMAATPEPATLVLAGLGVVGIGLGRLRRGLAGICSRRGTAE
jgi:hypothetical protein